jgi:hypothetical protein
MRPWRWDMDDAWLDFLDSAISTHGVAVAAIDVPVHADL